MAAYGPLLPLTLWRGEAPPFDAALDAVAAAHAADGGPDHPLAAPAGVLLAWPLAQGHIVVRLRVACARVCLPLARALTLPPRRACR